MDLLRIIDEIRRQRGVVGRRYAKHVVLSSSAFEQLLAEKEEYLLHQFDTESIPPTIYDMSIIVADGDDREVSVLTTTGA